MMGRFDKLIGTVLARGVWSWTPDDALIYALGVGAGLEQPYAELQFTTENTEGLPQKVIPTFLSLMSTSELWMRPLGFREREWEGLSWGWREGLVHGEQGITLARPLPTAGTADISLELVGVHDKGSGALVIADTHVRLADRFRTMNARFASPMFPGEALTTLIWRMDDGARFQMLANDGRPVLERGAFGVAR